MMSTKSELQRCITFERRIQKGCCTRLKEFQEGAALFHDQLQSVWDLNFVVIDREAEELLAPGLAAIADRLQGAAGLKHRRICVESDTAGEKLAPGFRRMGWSVTRLVPMVLRRPEEATRPFASVEEVAFDPYCDFIRAFVGEQPYGSDEEVVRQLVAKDALVREAAGTRFFAAYDSGRIVSGCQLFSDGRTAQIEDVGTLMAFRGRGCAKAVVSRAVREALLTGHDLVFLVADEDDWPKEFYERLGFKAVGRTWVFLRAPEAEPQGSR